MQGIFTGAQVYGGVAGKEWSKRGKKINFAPINTVVGRDLVSFCAVLWDFLPFPGMERVGTEQERLLGERTTKVKQVELSGGFKNK